MSDVSTINGYNIKDAVSRGAIYGVTSGALLTGAGSSAVVNAYTPAWQAWVAGTTSGPQAKIKLGNVDYTSNAIPSASSSASGIVTTGNQTFSGRKTMELISPKIYDGTGNESRYKYVYFANNAGSQVGAVRYDSGSTTNVTSGMFSLLQYSPNSTNNTSTTGYYESYDLPTVNTGLSANATYDIVTTKPITLSSSTYGQAINNAYLHFEVPSSSSSPFITALAMPAQTGSWGISTYPGTDETFIFIYNNGEGTNNSNTKRFYLDPSVGSLNNSYEIITSAHIGWKVESITFTSGFKSGVTCTGVTTSSTIVASCNTSATADRTRTLSTILCSTAGSVNIALTTNTSSLTEKIAIMWTK